MRILRYTADRDPVQFPHDCKRIVEALRKYGFSVSIREAEYMWREYSDTLCAGWIMLPENDDDIFFALTEEKEW